MYTKTLMNILIRCSRDVVVPPLGFHLKGVACHFNYCVGRNDFGGLVLDYVFP